mmetsp:Transcript_1390/g.1838  ORF Transcript_1390/g.1838 Transcript_1390/m.1838 type:complete len:146 (+) Transcript_1390:3351-3788(+)
MHEKYLLNQSEVTTESEQQRYQAFSTHVTGAGMIQSTIYHIRKYGENIFDPDEKEKYYSDHFLQHQRHVNDKVEQELVEFKIEIDEKVASNVTKNFVFPRPAGQRIHLNTDSNHIDDEQKSRHRSRGRPERLLDIDDTQVMVMEG